MRALHWSVLVSLVVAIAIAACGGEEATAPSDDPSLAGGKHGLAAPSELVATTTGSRTIDLTWKDNATSESGFEIHRSTTGAAGPFEVYGHAVQNGTAFGLVGLAPATAYCHRVRALSAGPQRKLSFSAFSNTACATTKPPAPPASPSDLGARPVHNLIVLSWTNNATNATSIIIERSGSLGGPWSDVRALPSNATSYQEGHSQSGGQELPICYRVSAQNDDGISPSAPDCTTPPARPSGLAATVTGGSVALSWTDNSRVEDGLAVERRSGDGVWSVVATVGADVVSHSDATALPNVIHSYRVSATKDGGGSAPSDSVTALIATAPPSPPTSFTAVPQWGWMALSWRHPVGLATAFRVERSSDGLSEWATANVTTDRSPSGLWSLEDAGIGIEMQSCYRVIAINSGGESVPTAVRCAVVPAGPTDLRGTIRDDGFVDLRWIDNSSVEEGYEIWLISPVTWWPVFALPANSTHTIVERPGSGWGYAIFALNDGGFSDYVFWQDAEPFGTPNEHPVRAATVPASPLHDSMEDVAMRIRDRIGILLVAGALAVGSTDAGRDAVAPQLDVGDRPAGPSANGHGHWFNALGEHVSRSFHGSLMPDGSYYIGVVRADGTDQFPSFVASGVSPTWRR